MQSSGEVSLSDVRQRAAIEAFTRLTGAPPRTVLPVVLVSVTVACISMMLDQVHRFSRDAFAVGIVLTAGLAFVITHIVETIARRRPAHGILAALVLPTAFGGLIGMAVQAIVLGRAELDGMAAVKDLGGLIDTTNATTWIASGIVLGGFPALLVSAFLLLAARAARRLGGHDAGEQFGAQFTGAAGVLAAIAFVAMGAQDRVAFGPLVGVTAVSFVTVLAVLLVDGSRMRLLQRVYDDQVTDVEVAPKSRFANDATLLPMVAKVNATSVLVRVHRDVSYRGAAAEPIALVADTAEEMLRPLRRRRAVAAALLVTMAGLLAVGAISLYEASMLIYG